MSKCLSDAENRIFFRLLRRSPLIRRVVPLCCFFAECCRYSGCQRLPAAVCVPRSFGIAVFPQQPAWGFRFDAPKQRSRVQERCVCLPVGGFAAHWGISANQQTFFAAALRCLPVVFEAAAVPAA